MLRLAANNYSKKKKNEAPTKSEYVCFKRQLDLCVVNSPSLVLLLRIFFIVGGAGWKGGQDWGCLLSSNQHLWQNFSVPRPHPAPDLSRSAGRGCSHSEEEGRRGGGGRISWLPWQLRAGELLSGAKSLLHQNATIGSVCVCENGALIWQRYNPSSVCLSLHQQCDSFISSFLPFSFLISFSSLVHHPILIVGTLLSEPPRPRWEEEGARILSSFQEGKWASPTLATPKTLRRGLQP